MVSVIIVAGGKGVRMKATVRKQYLFLEGLPILSRTLSAFDECDAVRRIYLVIPEGDFDFCRENILSPLSLRNKISLVSGGMRRQDSVHNGILAMDDPSGIVLIHDGVRPFVRTEEIMACVSGAEAFGACIPGIPAYDTLKYADHPDNTIRRTLDRKGVWLAQTPQAFQYDLIRRAHETAKHDGYTGTDDASLVERMGETVKIISGSRFNIKITTPEDVRLAEAIFKGFKF